MRSGVPVLVMRDTTECPEGVEAGKLKLARESRISAKVARKRPGRKPKPKV